MKKLKEMTAEEIKNSTGEQVEIDGRIVTICGNSIVFPDGIYFCYGLYLESHIRKKGYYCAVYSAETWVKLFKNNNYCFDD